jgi:hypothetical protein
MWPTTFRLGFMVLLALPACALAIGDITTTIDGDTLIVTGDELGNRLEISQGTAEGSWRLSGVDGTTVNGFDVTEISATRHLRVVLAGGPDEVQLDRLTVPGRVVLAGGDGEDRLRIRGGRIRGELTMLGGRASDTLDLYEGFRVRGEVRLLGGDGGDRIVLERGRLDGSTIIVTGRGDDDVWLLDLDARRASTLRVITDDGRDDVTLEDSDFGDDVRVRLGEDDDDLWIANADFDDDLEVNGGDDDDELNLGRGVDVDGGFDVDEFEYWW